MGGVDGVDAVAGAAVDVVWEVLIITKVEVAGVGVGARGTQEGKARSDAERRRQRGGMENATEWHGSNLLNVNSSGIFLIWHICSGMDPINP